jgi:hypothetical protein
MFWQIKNKIVVLSTINCEFIQASFAKTQVHEKPFTKSKASNTKPRKAATFS